MQVLRNKFFHAVERTLSENGREIRLKCSSADRLHKNYTDHQKQNPHCLWTTKVSFSCRHPTHLITPCEVTFSSYLPRHMTGEHESSNQENGTKGSMNIAGVKGPLSLQLKGKNRKTRDKTRCRGTACKAAFICKVHRAL